MESGTYTVERISKVSDTLGSSQVGLFGKVGAISKYAIDVTKIKSIIMDEELNNESIYYAFQFGTTYKIYRDGVWKSIVRNNVDTYEYLNISGLWVTAPENTSESALYAASLIATNQMTITTLNNIPSTAYVETPESITVIFGPTSEGNCILKGKLIATSEEYSPEGTDIRWRITSTSPNPVTVYGVALNWN